MKKRLTLILAVALIVITCGAMLIGCTPSKPKDYIAKWAEAETSNKSMTTISYEDVQKEVLKKENGEKFYIKVNGVKTTEVTIIVNGDSIMEKTIESTKWNDKNTAEIVPTSAYIYESAKDDNGNEIYNVYNYGLKNDKYEWVAYQTTKATLADDAKYNDMINKMAEASTKFTELTSTFEQNYKKEKGGWFVKTNEDGSTESMKVSSGELVINDRKDNRRISGQKFELNEKFTITSGASAALTEFKETTTGTLKSVTTNKDKTTYVIDVDGTEYKVNEKVTGADILKTAQVGEKLSVRVTKNFFGKKSVSKIFAIVVE